MYFRGSNCNAQPILGSHRVMSSLLLKRERSMMIHDEDGEDVNDNSEDDDDFTAN